MKSVPSMESTHMSKKLHSLLEIAVVIGGLAGTPVVVAASLAPLSAVAATEPVALTAAEHQAAPFITRTAELRF
jgi:hypothetical protein